MWGRTLLCMLNLCYNCRKIDCNVNGKFSRFDYVVSFSPAQRRRERECPNVFYLCNAVLVYVCQLCTCGASQSVSTVITHQCPTPGFWEILQSNASGAEKPGRRRRCMQRRRCRLAWTPCMFSGVEICWLWRTWIAHHHNIVWKNVHLLSIQCIPIKPAK